MKDELTLPDHLNKTTLANDISKFFVRKVERIRGNIDAIPINFSDRDLVPPDKPMTDANHDHMLHSFKTLTECEVKHLIQKMAKKSCILDPVPTTLVHNCLDMLLPCITRIVNTSLSTAHFPGEWKEALVTPLLKKGAKDSEYKNLRPVSNLQFVSKVVERAVFDQVYSHMAGNELFPVFQSAYREFHSTETALLRVVNDILLNMNRRHVSLLVLLDLIAAFDTVDHDSLLHRLETSFGITGSAIKWFTSYLSNRSQRVSLKGTLSDSHCLPFGVPQGSCLGPLLFTVYASKLYEVIKNHLPNVHTFADDTQLYMSFKPDSSVSEAQAISSMERCITALRTWMLVDKLMLNDSKTQFMIIGTHQQLSKTSIDRILVGNTSVAPVNEARNLGVWFDPNMNFNIQITKTCNLAFYSLHNIRRIRKYLTYNSTKTLVHALVSGRLDYCNSLLYGLPATHIDKLQRVQNAAARLVANTPRFCHISPIMSQLHWLPVKFRIIYKIILITFKALHGQAPQYITELIYYKRKSNHNLRSDNKCLLAPPAVKTAKTTGDRAFASAAPTLWNRLPTKLRAETTLSSFKSSLKTYLFKQAYDL